MSSHFWDAFHFIRGIGSLRSTHQKFMNKMEAIYYCSSVTLRHNLISSSRELFMVACLVSKTWGLGTFRTPTRWWCTQCLETYLGSVSDENWPHPPITCFKNGPTSSTFITGGFVLREVRGRSTLCFGVKRIRVASSSEKLPQSQSPFLWNFLLGKGHILTGKIYNTCHGTVGKL